MDDQAKNIDVARDMARESDASWALYSEYGEAPLKEDAQHSATLALVHAAIAQADALGRIADLLGKITVTTYDGTRSAINVHTDK